jgi:hypothetical protein
LIQDLIIGQVVVEVALELPAKSQSRLEMKSQLSQIDRQRLQARAVTASHLIGFQLLWVQL